MGFPALLATTRARLLAVAAAGVLLALLWQRLTPPPVSAPKRIASHPRHEDGYYFDLAERVRSGAADDPRLGETVAAAYGERSQPLPTLGVLAGVIKFGHGGDIAASLVSGLSGGGVTLGPRAAIPPGKHGGTVECGSVAFGTDAGMYCIWWNTSVIGVALVSGPDTDASRALALQARNSTQR